MLHRRQLIPPLTLSDAQGRTIRAWDFKQSKNLVIAFLDADCAVCERCVGELIKHAAELGEKEAVALLAFPQEPTSSLTASLTPGLISGTDVGGHGARAFLGAEASPTQQLRLRGVFVTDRYGEVSSKWVFEGHEFPDVSEVLSALDLVEIACEECSVPHWPVDE